MGAYTNPRAIIDTQTPQMWQNVQNQISGAVGKTMDRKRIQDALDKKKRDDLSIAGGKARDAQTLDMHKRVNNIATVKGVNVQEKFVPIVKEAGEVAHRIGMNAGGDNTDDIARLAVLDASVNSFVTMQANAQTLLQMDPGFWDMDGKPGGLDPNTIGDIRSTVQIFNERRDGSIEMPFVDGEFRYVIKDGEDKVVFSASAAEMSSLSDGGKHIIPVIPNMVPQGDNVNVAVGAILMKEDANGVGVPEPNPDFYKEEIIDDRDEKNKVHIRYRPFNRKKFISLGGEQVKAVAASMASDPNSLESYYNSVLKKGKKDDIVIEDFYTDGEANGEVWDNFMTTFKDEYLEHHMDSMKQRYVVSEDVIKESTTKVTTIKARMADKSNKKPIVSADGKYRLVWRTFDKGKPNQSFGWKLHHNTATAEGVDGVETYADPVKFRKWMYADGEREDVAEKKNSSDSADRAILGVE